MNIDDALGLHNAFRRGRTWHAANAFSCDEPPTDALLALESVYLFSPDAEWIEKISESKVLRSLAIKAPRTSDLSPLKNQKLIQFEISYPTKIKSWGFLSRLTRLRRLVVENATTLSDLSCLEELRLVEFLGVAGGYSKPLKAASLSPLAGMTALRAIYLANVRFKAWDLAALRSLKHLELLYTPKWCPTEEIATLRQAIPSLGWNWDLNQ